MTEIQKLCDLLDSKGIKYKRIPLWGGEQIQLYSHGVYVDDAVCHRFSHGYEKGLLETDRLNCCHGYETAEEVYNGWMKMIKEMF